MHIKSPIQEAYSLKDSFEWGRFFTYIEIGKDKFAERSVRIYENGFITCYDRVHWEDQFGSLPDYRFGESWIKHWGEPVSISSEEFKFLWTAASQSKPFKIRSASPKTPCIWIELFESGKWGGQP